MNFQDRIVGHRGFGVLAPENTLFALEKAADFGLKYVEFDVRLTCDGVPVISHDDSLMRCAGDPRCLSETPYDELQDVNAAATYALDESLDETIPTLLEYLQKARELELICQIELKPHGDDFEALVFAAAKEIDNFYEGEPSECLPLVTSFHSEALAAFKGKLPSIQTGLLIKVPDIPVWDALAVRSQCDYVHMNAMYLTSELAAHIVERGYGINGYHVNHPVKAKRAIEKGCERFTSSVPDLFLQE